MTLGIAGLRVGTWTSPAGHTGCTVLLPPPGTLGVIAVRGMAPATREAAALGPHGKLTEVHGVVLGGSSAYGLAAADGVVRYLEERGTGYDIGEGVVPIVGAAGILDRGALAPEGRVDAAAGYAAAEAATDGPVSEGSVGAGTGASVAKVGGLQHGWASGQGVASRRHGDLEVHALVVNNAVGELVGEDGRVVAASRAPEGGPRYPFASLDEVFAATAPTGEGPTGEGPTGNTVIGVVATNADLTRSEALRVADLAHGGTVLAVRPAHTAHDGDALFCLSSGAVPARLDLVALLAVEAVAAAARRAVRSASPRDGLPALGSS